MLLLDVRVSLRIGSQADLRQGGFTSGTARLPAPAPSAEVSRVIRGPSASLQGGAAPVYLAAGTRSASATCGPKGPRGQSRGEARRDRPLKKDDAGGPVQPRLTAPFDTSGGSVEGTSAEEAEDACCTRRNIRLTRRGGRQTVKLCTRSKEVASVASAMARPDDQGRKVER